MERVVMVNNFFLFVLLCFCSTTAFTQVQRDTLANGIIIVKDSRYNLLSSKKAEINKKATIARTPVKGFRLQIMNTTDRTEVLDAKAKMLSLYPEQKLYLSYQAPYFKLRMGNFKEYAEAAAFKKEINELFPKGITIIPSNIEFKPDKEELNAPPAQP